MLWLGCDRRAAVAAALLVLAVHAPGAGAERPPASDPVTLEGCQDAFAPIPASAAEVRRHVPDVDASRYRIFGEELGLATLVVRIFACDSVAVPGFRPRPTLGAQFGVTLQSPDGTGRVLGTDACCNWYTFFWVTDNQDFAGWLKDGTGLRGAVRYVPHLVYRYEPGLGSATASISFAARAPTPSPFELEATVLTPPHPSPAVAIAPNWWAETDLGSIKIASDVPAFRPYQANGEVRTRTGTRMAALFGAKRRPFGSPFSYGRWDRSFTTKHTVRSGVRARGPSRPPRPAGTRW